MNKIIITILMMVVIIWTIYSMYIKLDDRNGEIRLIADIYWHILLLILLFIICYGVVDRLVS